MASTRKFDDEHIKLIKTFLPRERGVKRVHLKKTLNGTLHVLRTGRPWRDMPSRFGNHKTAYNMFRRYSLNGVWNRIHEVLVSRKAEMSVSMLDASFAGAHRTSASLAVGVGSERAIGKEQGRVDHQDTNGRGREGEARRLSPDWRQYQRLRRLRDAARHG